MTHTAVRMDKDLKDRLDRLASARRQPAAGRRHRA